jgi:hypothetical protein
MAVERPGEPTVPDDEFDLDIRVKVASRQVAKFVLADTDSCASTCGEECTNSCASTCEGGCTDTCETCGSCTSECDADDSGECRMGPKLFEDRIDIQIDQVRADGVARRVERREVIRRVER